MNLLLTVPFFHMFEKHNEYYCKTILYGFFEYAVTREKPRDSGNRNLLTETLVGILHGNPLLGWIGAYVAFYTVESQKNGDGS